MLNADPVDPVWGPMCPWGPGYGRSGGGWGPFRCLGTGLVCREPNLQKTVSAVTRRHRGAFGNVSVHRKRVRDSPLSSSDDVEGFHPSFFKKIAIYWFSEGSGHLEKFQAPTDEKQIDRKKKSKKR